MVWPCGGQRLHEERPSHRSPAGGAHAGYPKSYEVWPEEQREPKRQRLKKNDGRAKGGVVKDSARLVLGRSAFGVLEVAPLLLAIDFSGDGHRRRLCEYHDIDRNGVLDLRPQVAFRITQGFSNNGLQDMAFSWSARNKQWIEGPAWNILYYDTTWGRGNRTRKIGRQHIWRV